MHRMAEQERDIKSLQTVISAMAEANRQRDLELARKERNQLLAGVSFLGAVIMTLFGVIWSYRSVIFREM